MKKHKILLILIGIIYLSLNGKAQDISIKSQQTFGNEKHNFSYDLLQLEGGDYILLADTETDSSSMDYLIYYVKGDGEVLWSKTFGGEAVERPSKLISDNNAGFYVIGSSSSNQGDFQNNHGAFDVWLSYYSLGGKLLWSRTYGGSENDFGVDAILLDNGNILIGGTTQSSDFDIENNHGEGDFWLFEIDTDANIIWSKTYGGSQSETFNDMMIDKNDTLWMIGGSKSADGDVGFNRGEKDVWLLKTDLQGNFISANTYGGSDNDEGKIVCKSHYNNLIFTAISRSEDGDISKSFGKNDFWVCEINEEQQLLWQRSYGGSKDDAPKTMFKTNDGYLLGGSTYSFDGNITENKGRSDVWLLKIYKNGQINWQKTFGGSGVESCISIIYSDDANYITANNTDSFDFDVEESIGETDLWMLDLCEEFVTNDIVTICPGDSLYWDGNYIKEEGMYAAEYISKCGLDSLIQLDLTVMKMNDLGMINGPGIVEEFTGVDYSVNEFENMQYFWDVENGNFKDTTFTFHTKVIWHDAGQGLISVYALQNDLCYTDTLELPVKVSGVGVEENADNQINVYPNPSTDGRFFVKNIKSENIKVFNLQGVEIKLYDVNISNENTISFIIKQKGVFILQVDGRSTYRLLNLHN